METGKESPWVGSCLDWTEEIPGLKVCKMTGKTLGILGRNSMVQRKRFESQLYPQELFRTGGRVLRLSGCWILTGERKILEPILQGYCKD